ncbi:alpha-ketoglutarate-dependent dioxygenase AlkB [soil metagenome]
MSLFENDSSFNLLPYDGEVFYFREVFKALIANECFDQLSNTIEWKQDEVVMFGKHIITKRKVAWYGDKNFSYTYSHTTREALAFTQSLVEIKQLAESLTNATYNSCLLNLYHNGDEGMGWHSDDENTIVKNSAIASVSFGAARKFSFRHKKSKETISVMLENGSVLVMKAGTQINWHHALPKSKRITEPRINLTFRKMIG